MDAASNAFASLAVVLESFRQPPTDVDTKPFSDFCCRQLQEHWDGVVRWIRHLILRSPASLDTRMSLDVCIHTLYAVILDYALNPYKEDIVIREETVDIICLALCQTDPSTGRYYYISSHDDEPCTILETLNTYVNEKPGREAMLLRLASMGPKGRKRIVTALSARSAQITRATVGEVISRGFLLTAVARMLGSRDMWKLFHREKWFTRNMAQLQSIGRKAQRAGLSSQLFWQVYSNSISAVAITLMQCAPAPTKEMHTLVEQGLFTCASIAFPHLNAESPPNMLATALQHLLSYLYLRKVIDAVEDRGEVEMWQQSRRLGPILNPVYLEYRTALQCVSNAHFVDSGVPVNMCSNPSVSRSLSSLLDIQRPNATNSTSPNARDRSSVVSRTSMCGLVVGVIPLSTAQNSAKRKTGTRFIIWNAVDYRVYTKVSPLFITVVSSIHQHALPTTQARKAPAHGSLCTPSRMR